MEKSVLTPYPNPSSYLKPLQRAAIIAAATLVAACTSPPQHSTSSPADAKALPTSTSGAASPANSSTHPASPTPSNAGAQATHASPTPTGANHKAPFVTAQNPTSANQPSQELSDRSGVAGLEAPTDIWARIRTGFAMADLDSPIVQERTQWYANQPAYLERMTERSRKYLFHIVEELEKRQMPSELALLPFVESAFNPQAVSSAKAAGMWQFMPATGRDFDLTQNLFRDDRRDILASTDAALDYLQRLHGLFGDWHLALAAYNWGQGNVQRAIKRNEQLGLGTSYNELSMPLETRHYVPKLLALKNIVSNPTQYNANLANIGNHPYFDSIEITRDIDVEVAAEMAEISVADFKALNPSANRPVIFAAGTPHILLPWDNATIFQRNMAAAGQRQLASWTAWRAPTSMSAAAAASQVGMSLEQLRSVNRIPAGMRIQAGSTLLVPRGEQRQTEVSADVADNARLALSPEMVVVRQYVKARKGDTIAKVAARYGMSARQVANWNGKGIHAKLKKGQSVMLQVVRRVGDNHPIVARAIANQDTNREQAKNKSKSNTKNKSNEKISSKNKKNDKNISSIKKSAKTTTKVKAKEGNPKNKKDVKSSQSSKTGNKTSKNNKN